MSIASSTRAPARRWRAGRQRRAARRPGRDATATSSTLQSRCGCRSSRSSGSGVAGRMVLGEQAHGARSERAEAGRRIGDRPAGERRQAARPAPLRRAGPSGAAGCDRRRRAGIAIRATTSARPASQRRQQAVDVAGACWPSPSSRTRRVVADARGVAQARRASRCRPPCARGKCIQPDAETWPGRRSCHRSSRRRRPGGRGRGSASRRSATTPASVGGFVVGRDQWPSVRSGRGREAGAQRPRGSLGRGCMRVCRPRRVPASARHGPGDDRRDPGDVAQQM